MESSKSRVLTLTVAVLWFLNVSFCTQSSPHQASPVRSLAKRETSVSVPLIPENGLWFLNATVGGQDGLRLLLDTGSANTALNPNKYDPSEGSVGLNGFYSETFDMANSSGIHVGTLNGSLVQDVVTVGGITVENQDLGLVAQGESTMSYPGDGIIGLGVQSSATSNSTSWLQSLCEDGLVDECRFGVAMENNDRGALILGGQDDSLFDGNMGRDALIDNFSIHVDLVIGSRTLMREDILVELSTRRTFSVGPISAVSVVFQSLQVETALQNTTDGPVLTSIVPCENNYTVGFRFPSSTTLVSDGSIVGYTFYFELDALVVPMPNATDVCTLSLIGRDFADSPDHWILGQNWFRGKYVDHNLDDDTLGIAYLRSAGYVPVPSQYNTSRSNSEQNTAGGLRANPGIQVWTVCGLVLIMYFVFGLEP